MPSKESIRRPSWKLRSRSDYGSVSSGQGSSNNTSARASFESSLSLPSQVDKKDNYITNGDINDDGIIEEDVLVKNRNDQSGVWKKTWKSWKKPG